MLGIQDGSQPLRRRNKSSKKFVIIRTPKNEACFLPMTQNCDSKAAVEPISSSTPQCSPFCGVKSEELKSPEQVPSSSTFIHEEDVPAQELLPCTSSVAVIQYLPLETKQYQEQCDCVLCNHLHNLTETRLTAPLEKPYDPVKRDAAVPRPSLEPDCRLIIRNVGLFFDELRDLLGPCCRGTLLNSPLAMAALACGVSRRTVNTYCSRQKVDPWLNAAPKRMKNFEKFAEEWGDIVHKFVCEELKQEGEIAVGELYKRFRALCPEFPLSLVSYASFLEKLGFSHRIENNRKYILQVVAEVKREPP